MTSKKIATKITKRVKVKRKPTTKKDIAELVTEDIGDENYSYDLHNNVSITQKSKIEPLFWMLPNKKSFPEWINNTF